MITHAMLMAAGLGTRLRPFTELEPKALLPLMGVPMAQFALDALAEAGVGNVVANIHHHSTRARVGLLALERGQMGLEISDESEQLLGSAGGLRKALPRLGGGPFILANADTLCDIDLRALAAQHEQLRRRWGVWLTLTVFRAGPRGGTYPEILFDPSSELITGIGKPASESPFFVGVAIMEPEALREVPMSGPAETVPLIVEPAIRARKAGIFFADGNWHDVGSPALWHSAHLGLIRGLETGRIAKRWRTRIENVSRRVAQEVWVSRAAPSALSRAEWSGPAYWSPRSAPSMSSLGASHAPRALGPRSVLYGSLSPECADPRDGIGYGGIWAPVAEIATRSEFSR